MAKKPFQIENSEKGFFAQGSPGSLEGGSTSWQKIFREQKS